MIFSKLQNVALMFVAVTAFTVSFNGQPVEANSGANLATVVVSSNTEIISLTATGENPVESVARDAAYADMWDMINAVEAMLGPNQSITDIVVTGESFDYGVYTVTFEIEITIDGPPGA